MKHEGIDANFTKEEFFEYFGKLTSHESAPDTSSENKMGMDQIQTDCP